MYIRIIIYRNQKHLEFSTIRLLIGDNFARTTLWRYLNKNKKIKSFMVKNERIYNLTDLLSDSFLIEKMAFPELLSKALEEE